MPSLSGIPNALGVDFTDAFGRTVRGVLRPPPPAGPFFDGGLSPRRMLVVSPNQPLASGAVLEDFEGNRFLCANWSPDGLLGKAHSRTFVMIAITADLSWTRLTTAVEPISGQTVKSGTTALGTVTCAQEFVRRKNDALDIEEEIYRVLCAEMLQLGDYLGSYRVTRVEKGLGLTYAEII